jgi:WD40 repeat protein
MRTKFMLIMAIFAIVLLMSPQTKAGDYAQDTVWTTPGNNGSSEDIALSPDESQVAVSYSGIATTYIYDAISGDILDKVHSSAYATCIVYSDDGKYLYLGISTYRYILVVDTQDYSVIDTLKGMPGDWQGISAMDINSSGTRLILGFSSDIGLVLYDLVNKKVIRERENEDKVEQVFFSPDDSKIIVHSQGGKDFGILDSETLETIKSVNLVGMNTIAVSPDGQYVAAARTINSQTHYEVIINVYDINSYEVVSTFTEHYGDISAITFSNDSRSIISTSTGISNKIYYWDIITGKSFFSTNFPSNPSKLIITNNSNYLYAPSSTNLYKFKTYWFYTPVEENIPEENILYPNPTNGQVILKINSDSHQEAHIGLYDSQGMIQLEFDHSLMAGINEIPIDASFLSSGSYIIRIETNSFSTTFKLIRE